MHTLLQIINTTSNKNIYKKATQIIPTLCLGKTLRLLGLVEITIPTVIKIIQRETDLEIVTSAVSAIFYTFKTKSEIQKLVETGVIPSLVSYLK